MVTSIKEDKNQEAKVMACSTCNVALVMKEQQRKVSLQGIVGMVLVFVGLIHPKFPRFDVWIFRNFFSKISLNFLDFFSLFFGGHRNPIFEFRTESTPKNNKTK